VRRALTMQPGDVIHCWVPFTNPAKNKFAVCLCPIKGYFFFINTKPWPFAIDAQIQITTIDLPFLSHDSFVDTHQVIHLNSDILLSAGSKGVLPANVKAAIVMAVSQSKHLPQTHKDIIIQNFS